MKKNIIFRSGSLRMGGLERVLIETLQTIDKEKYNITLFIEDDSGKENVFLKDVPSEIKIYFLKPEELMRKTEYYRKNKKNIFNKLMYNLMMAKEKKIVIENTKKYIELVGTPDVFIDYDWGAVKYIEKLNLPKTIVWIHNSVPKLLGERVKKIERFGKRLAKYTKIVAICDDMKEEIEKIYPYLKGKVERIYNPFNFERIKNLSNDASSLTEEQKKLIKEEYCVAVSRLDTVQKDYETLIKAFSILKEKNNSIKLYIVGDGQDREKIEAMIKFYKLDKNIILIGQTKNPYIWMKNSKFFVHSSKYEGLPTVLIEAMICDKVVISSDCPTGPREILKDNSGILYQVGDYKRLASEIEKLSKDEELRESYLERVRVRRDEFNKNSVIKEYQNLIEKI